MCKYLGLGRVVAVGLMASPTAAFAGAWTLDAGQRVAIVTGTLSQADQTFDGSGNRQSIPRYSKNELQALFEFGATNWLTLMLAPSLQHVSIAAPFEAQRSGLGYTDIGARARLGGGDSWVVSAQTTLRVPGTFDKNNPAAIGYTDPEVDVRALFGYSFKAGTWPAFVDVQVAQRFRLGGPPDEFRADFTLGVRPQDRWLVLLQSFNVISEGAGNLPLFPSYSYSKLQLSAVYSVTPKLSLQLGGYTTYWGQNALQENGLVLGAWYKF
jgi:protein XagA